MEERNIPELDEWFGLKTDYGCDPSKWNELMHMHAEGTRTVVVAEHEGKTVGYCTLKFASEYPSLKEENIPEINDLVFAPSTRRQVVSRSII